MCLILYYSQFGKFHRRGSPMINLNLILLVGLRHDVFCYQYVCKMIRCPCHLLKNVPLEMIYDIYIFIYCIYIDHISSYIGTTALETNVLWQASMESTAGSHTSDLG